MFSGKATQIARFMATAATVLTYPDSKVHGANMGPIWDRQHQGGPHIGPMNLAIWVAFPENISLKHLVA